MTQDDVLRYLSLVDRRLEIVLHSGIDWNPEYGPELDEIDQELSRFRNMIDQEHARRMV